MKTKKKKGRGPWTAAQKRAFKKTIKERKHKLQLEKLISDGQKKYEERHKKSEELELGLYNQVAVAPPDEIEQMSKICFLLNAINNDARVRIVQYLLNRYGRPFITDWNDMRKGVMSTGEPGGL